MTIKKDGRKKQIGLTLDKAMIEKLEKIAAREFLPFHEAIKRALRQGIQYDDEREKILSGINPTPGPKKR